jgi:hypothetical protein
MEKSSQDRLVQMDFQYPLNCIFNISTIDPRTKKTVFVYDRKISVQAGALHDGLQLHLATLTKTRDSYRLSATATDNNQIDFKTIASITLTSTGTIKETNSRHLNTIILTIKD